MDQLEQVKTYYGTVLSSKNDLKSTACCSEESLASYLKPIVAQIHDEVKMKFYGCGVPIPPLLDGLTVLDLGSGSGRDCYVLSRLVGEKGSVIGVDMTPGQLEVANKYLNYHKDLFLFEHSNVCFKEGYIEDLASLGIADESIDLVVSNCVINLSPQKDKVFSEIYRVLKPGGELYFSDVYCDRRLNKTQKNDPILLGECLGGALYTEDFRRLMSRVGFEDFRTFDQNQITGGTPEVLDKIANAKFFGKTIRAFKLVLEDRCEDYGQVAIYKGGIPYSEHSFKLDDHHLFIKSKPMLVCSNTAKMLSETRFAEYFTLMGDESQHFGLFDCSESTVVFPAEEKAGCC